VRPPRRDATAECVIAVSGLGCWAARLPS
jgi:hypothetical protein